MKASLPIFLGLLALTGVGCATVQPAPDAEVEPDSQDSLHRPFADDLVLFRGRGPDGDPLPADARIIDHPPGSGRQH